MNEQLSEAQQFVSINYPFNEADAVIDVAFSTHSEAIEITANKDGMALLAGLIADFLLVSDPAKLSYMLSGGVSLTEGSLSLVFEYSPSLDTEVP